MKQRTINVNYRIILLIPSLLMIACGSTNYVIDSSLYNEIMEKGKDYRADIIVMVDSTAMNFEGDQIIVRNDSVHWLDPKLRLWKSASSSQLIEISFTKRTGPALINLGLSALISGASLHLGFQSNSHDYTLGGWMYLFLGAGMNAILGTAVLAIIGVTNHYLFSENDIKPIVLKKVIQLISNPKSRLMTIKTTFARFRDDDAFVLEAVKQNGLVLQYASDRLRDSMDIVSEAINQNGIALQFASDRLKKNKTIVLGAISRNDRAWDFGSDSLKDDADFMQETFRRSGLNLKYASVRLKDRKEVVLKAVIQDGLALEFASDSLKDDEEVVLEAFIQNENAAEFMSTRLKNDREFVKQAFKKRALK